MFSGKTVDTTRRPLCADCCSPAFDDPKRHPCRQAPRCRMLLDYEHEQYCTSCAYKLNVCSSCGRSLRAQPLAGYQGKVVAMSSDASERSKPAGAARVPTCAECAALPQHQQPQLHRHRCARSPQCTMTLDFAHERLCTSCSYLLNQCNVCGALLQPQPAHGYSGKVVNVAAPHTDAKTVDAAARPTCQPCLRVVRAAAVEDRRPHRCRGTRCSATLDYQYEVYCAPCAMKLRRCTMCAEPLPDMPPSGYQGSLRTVPDSVRPDLGTSAVVSSTRSKVNIVAPTHIEDNPVPLAKQPIKGYSGYVPRHLKEEAAGRSVWHAISDYHAQSPPIEQPSNVEDASPKFAIAAVPGYRGHVPQTMRGENGKFRVATGIDTAPSRQPPTSPARHVTGYSGYVPQEFRPPGKSTIAAVTRQEPAPDDLRMSRTIFGTSRR